MPRYLLSLIAKDDTGDANFFPYDEEAKLIIQKDCEALINPLTQASGLPQALQRIFGKEYTFGINLTDDSCRGPFSRQYLVKSVLQRPTRQNTSTDTLPTQLVPANPQIATANLLDATSPSTQIHQQQSEVLRIESGTQSTPAPPVDFDHDSAKKATPRLSSNVRKKLFGDVDLSDQGILSGDQLDIAAVPSHGTDTSIESLEQPASKRAKTSTTNLPSKDHANKSASRTVTD